MSRPRLQTNQAVWLFVALGVFLSLLSHGYPYGFFCKGVWLLVSMIKLLRTTFISLKRKNMSVFLIVEKIKWVGTPPGPRKRQKKLAVKLPFRRMRKLRGGCSLNPWPKQCSSHYRKFLFTSPWRDMYIYFAFTFPCITFFVFPFPITCPMIVRKSRTLVSLGMLLMRKRYYSKVSKYLSGATRRNNNRNTVLVSVFMLDMRRSVESGLQA